LERFLQALQLLHFLQSQKVSSIFETSSHERFMHMAFLSRQQLYCVAFLIQFLRYIIQNNLLRFLSLASLYEIKMKCVNHLVTILC